jgi:sporulation protein YlmC with PRC-barrel domain
MIDQASVPSLMGSTVRDNAGEKIGKVGQVYLDDTTGQPEWVTVRTGLFGTKESFLPLAAARVEGDELVVDIPKDRVSDAPKIDEDGHLSEEQETELYSYYGVSQGPFGRQTTPTADPTVDPTADPSGGTYAGTEPGRTGEGYPESDAGSDYATTDAPDAAGLVVDADAPAGWDDDAADGGLVDAEVPDGGVVDTDAERAAAAGTVADPAITERTGSRLRRWLVTDEQVSTPIVDEGGEVVGEVRAERVELTPADEGLTPADEDLTPADEDLTPASEDDRRDG